MPRGYLSNLLLCMKGEKGATHGARACRPGPSSVPTDVLFETGSLLRNAIAKVLPKDILDNVKRRLSPKCSLPSVVLAAYAHALGRAARGESVGRAVLAPRPHETDRRTYGQLATDANVLLDDLSPQPTVGAFAESVHRAVLEALANPTPYADDYVACTNGREAPLPAQYNWYDRYGDVPQWSGITARDRTIAGLVFFVSKNVQYRRRLPHGPRAGRRGPQARVLLQRCVLWEADDPRRGRCWLRASNGAATCRRSWRASPRTRLFLCRRSLRARAMGPGSRGNSGSLWRRRS